MIRSIKNNHDIEFENINQTGVKVGAIRGALIGGISSGGTGAIPGAIIGAIGGGFASGISGAVTASGAAYAAIKIVSIFR